MLYLQSKLILPMAQLQQISKTVLKQRCNKSLPILSEQKINYKVRNQIPALLFYMNCFIVIIIDFYLRFYNNTSLLRNNLEGWREFFWLNGSKIVLVVVILNYQSKNFILFLYLNEKIMKFNVFLLSSKSFWGRFGCNLPFLSEPPLE